MKYTNNETAKKILIDRFLKDGIGTPPDHALDSITKAMNEYLVYVAEKVIEKEKSFYSKENSPVIHAVLDKTLSNIKEEK